MTEHAPEFRVNPEWQALKGRENRFPNQFGGIGDNGDGAGVSFYHQNENGEALIIPGVNCSEEEAAQLRERNAIFPLEIAEPVKKVKFYTEVELFNEKGETTGFNIDILTNRQKST